MKKCIECGSHAFNPQVVERVDGDPELCDVCLLKRQRDELLVALARTRNLIRSAPDAAETCANDAIAKVKGRS